MFKWVVTVEVSCYEIPFEFNSAQEAEDFAKVAISSMQPYGYDDDGSKPRMARICITAKYINDKEDE